MQNEITASIIHPADRIAAGRINGRWCIEFRAWPGMYSAGTLVCDPAGDATDDLCFTAPDGNRYMDIPSGCRFTPRA
jgi:hypothetical protein